MNISHTYLKTNIYNKERINNMIKKVPLKEYFKIKSSIQQDKMHFQEADINDLDSHPFLSRSGKNNGINDYVVGPERLLNEGNVLSLALDGSTGSTFYQKHPFFSGQNIWLLIPKADKIKTFDTRIAMYVISSIKKAVSQYTYNLSLTKNRLVNINLMLPVLDDGNDTLDLEYIYDQMKNVKHIELLDEILEERYQILL